MPGRKVTSLTTREFRAAAAKLKRAGLLSGFDARSIYPPTFRGSPSERIAAAIKKFAGVVAGNQKTVRLSKAGVAERKTIGDRVFTSQATVSKTGRKIPALPTRVILNTGEKSKITKRGGRVHKIIDQHGIESLPIIVPHETLEQFLDDLESDATEINRMKEADEHFAFRMHGGNSRVVFGSIGQLRQYLLEYDNVKTAIRNHSAEDMAEIIHHLEIVKIPRGPARPAWEKERDKQDKDIYKRNRGVRNYQREYDRHENKLHRNPTLLKRDREIKADKARQYRLDLKTKSPDEYRDYISKAAKRSQKSRDRRKKK